MLHILVSSRAILWMTKTCEWQSSKNLQKKCLDFSTTGQKSFKNHKKSLKNHKKIIQKSWKKSFKKCSTNLQKNCLDFSTPGPKSAKNYDFPVEQSFKKIQKKCLDFSDPMFKIPQNPKKSGWRKNKKKCRTRGNGNALPPPHTVTKVTPPWIS